MNQFVNQFDFVRRLKFLLAVLFSVLSMLASYAWAQAEGEDDGDAPVAEQKQAELSPEARVQRLAEVRKQLSASRSEGDRGETLRLMRQWEQLSRGTPGWAEAALNLANAEYTWGSQARGLKLAEDLMAAPNLTPDQRASAAVRLLYFHGNSGDREQAERALPVAERAMRELPADLAPWRRAFIECRLLQAKSEVAALQGDIDRRVGFMREAIPVCQQYADESLAGRSGAVTPNLRAGVQGVMDGIFGTLTYALTRAGRADEAIAIAREGLATARNDNRLPESVAAWHMRLANAALYKRDFKLALEASEAGIEAFTVAGVEPTSQRMGIIHPERVLALVGQRRWAEADAANLAYQKSISGDAIARQRFTNTLRESMLAAKNGRAADVSERLERLLRYRVRTYGNRHRTTVETYAVQAIVNMSRGNTAGAMSDFDAVFDFLFDPNTAWQDVDSGGSGSVYIDVALNEFLAFIAERYRQGGAAAIDERLFTRLTKVIDRLSTGLVQRAIIDSTSRFITTQPELAALLRTEQDQRTQLRTAYSAVAALTMRDGPKTPDDERRKVREELKVAREKVQTINTQITATRKNIASRYPGYHALVNPAAPGPDDVRKVLQSGEAVISMYAAPGATYVWAVNANGQRALHVSKLGADEIAPRVNLLRTALDAGSFPADQLPRFNFDAAHELYNELIAPLSPALQGVNSMIIAGGGVLATMPLTVLVTQPTTGVDYKSAAWLGKQFAVANVPAVSALLAQRRAGTRSASGAFIGFGDPLFGAGAPVAAGKVRALVTGERARRAASYSAEQGFRYASIPALPETRDELLSIAKALGADAGRDVVLGDQATRKAVLSADLASRRVVAFATHGLLPGEIPGLSKPALAMAGVADGESPLLTLDDVLTLKLNSDWVVLSACNTAGGERDGEALSGLVRGFFFAGTRAVLATHWAVDSEASKQLVTAVFTHYAQNRGAARSASLRQAQLEMIDGKFGAAYAHPFFWAPYAFFGDPGK